MCSLVNQLRSCSLHTVATAADLHKEGHKGPLKVVTKPDLSLKPVTDPHPLDLTVLTLALLEPQCQVQGHPARLLTGQRDASSWTQPLPVFPLPKEDIPAPLHLSAPTPSERLPTLARPPHLLRDVSLSVSDRIVGTDAH
jgi:hypothetical protein